MALRSIFRCQRTDRLSIWLTNESLFQFILQKVSKHYVIVVMDCFRALSGPFLLYYILENYPAITIIWQGRYLRQMSMKQIQCALKVWSPEKKKPLTSDWLNSFKHGLACWPPRMNNAWKFDSNWSHFAKFFLSLVWNPKRNCMITERVPSPVGVRHVCCMKPRMAERNLCGYLPQTHLRLNQHPVKQQHLCCCHFLKLRHSGN